MQILKQIQIPYSFAKRHGVLLRYEGDQVFIVRRQNTEWIALQEARRIVGKPAQHQICDDQSFNALLSSSYAGDTGESQQVAAGLEDHPDLLSLADQVPEAEDLMDQEDDAPIVRLINALLSEAIRVNASDIHIESFEKKL
ncbi:MAG: type II secretion system protein GspE, partial [Pseudomonadota bacterium]|nr:type II secretion system protein GspE [Pseudomonadota bacterium]